MEFIERIKRYFRFDEEEIKSLAILTIIIALIFAFREFDPTLPKPTVLDFLLALFIVLLSLVVHVSVQKIFSYKIGYNAEFKIWWTGILISAMISIISRGKLWWIILPGGITYSLIAGLRLGRFRYGLNYKTMGMIAFLGPIANIALGTLFKNIDLYILQPFLHTPENPLLHGIFVFNLVYAVMTMLPIPPLDGHYMFYASRSWFVFLFSTIAVYTIMTVAFKFYSWIWAIIVGIIIVFVYYISYEKGAWQYI